MIAATIGYWPFGAMDTETMMYRFTELLNNGSDVSRPENFQWFLDMLARDVHVAAFNMHNPDMGAIQNAVRNQHVSMAGFNDYHNLRLADGSRPWPFDDGPGIGHVMLAVGYNASSGNPLFHDPLRANPDGQPAEYDWGSVQAAGFSDCTEILSGPIPFVPGSEYMLQISDVAAYYDEKTYPDGTVYWQAKANGKILQYGLLAFYRTLPFAQTGIVQLNENENVPNAPPNTAISVCERAVLVYDPGRVIDSPPGANGPAYIGHKELGGWMPAQGAPVGIPKGSQAATDINNALEALSKLILLAEV